MLGPENLKGNKTALGMRHYPAHLHTSGWPNCTKIRRNAFDWHSRNPCNTHHDGQGGKNPTGTGDIYGTLDRSPPNTRRFPHTFRRDTSCSSPHNRRDFYTLVHNARLDFLLCKSNGSRSILGLEQLLFIQENFKGFSGFVVTYKILGGTAKHPRILTLEMVVTKSV